MSSGNYKAKTLRDMALEGKSDTFKRQVLELVVKTGTAPEDPLFLILLSTGRLEVLLSKAPRELENLFKDWTAHIKKGLQTYEQAAVEGQKAAISEAVRDLIQQAEAAQRTRFFGSLVPAMGVLLAAIGIGAVLGAMGMWLHLGGSKGELARNIVTWNLETLVKCLDKNQAKCSLWVLPPPNHR